MVTALRRIISIDSVADAHVTLRFEDGSIAEIDFEPLINSGGVYGKLADPAFFKQVAIGGRGRTLAWPDDLDFCADALWLQRSGPCDGSESTRRQERDSGVS